MTPEQRAHVSVGRMGKALGNKNAVGHGNGGANRGRHLSPAHRAAISAGNRIGMLGNRNGRFGAGIPRPSLRGPLNHAWVDGRSMTAKDGRATKRWKRAVHARDNDTCQWCGKSNLVGLDRQADHIVAWADAPDLRFELSNGRTLCRKCHEARTAIQNRERMRALMRNRTEAIAS